MKTIPEMAYAGAVQWQQHKYVCITTNQPDTKSNSNSNPSPTPNPTTNNMQ